MQTTPTFEIRYTDRDSAAEQRAANYAAKRLAANQAVVNQANAQHSTGPRTPEGKARSAQNSLRHGLTAVSPILPTEDRAAYDRHIQEFIDEYKPKGPTETHLARDLADTAWRMNRIPSLEAGLFSLETTTTAEGSINVDIPDLDAALAITEALRRQERALNALSTHGNRLSRQFHKTLDHLRYIQAERRQQEIRDMRRAAAIFQAQKNKGIPYDPAQDGFVFSIEEIQTFVDRTMRHPQAKNLEIFLQCGPERLMAAGR